jgi:hypothetical protein
MPIQPLAKGDRPGDLALESRFSILSAKDKNTRGLGMISVARHAFDPSRQCPQTAPSRIVFDLTLPNRNSRVIQTVAPTDRHSNEKYEFRYLALSWQHCVPAHGLEPNAASADSLQVHIACHGDPAVPVRGVHSNYLRRNRPASGASAHCAREAGCSASIHQGVQP